MIPKSKSKNRQLENELTTLLDAIKEAIPKSEYPAEETVDNWAWIVKNLGIDWKLLKEKEDPSKLYKIRLLYLKWWQFDITDSQYFNEMEKLLEINHSSDCE